MKKYMPAIFLTFFLIASCTNSAGSSVPSAEEIETDKNKSSITIQNTSKYDVIVYTDSLRENKICEIKTQETYTVNNTVDSQEKVFYLTYLVDLGTKVSWFSNDSFVVVPVNGERINIPTPTSMTTSNCFLILENKSADQCIFFQGSGELKPENKDTTIISTGERAVYQISKNYFENFSSFKISTVNGKQIDFPEQMQKFNSGYIYSISISEKDSKTAADIKSISHFDPDAGRQIWSFSDNTFYSDSCVIRNAYKNDDGCLIMGTLTVNSKEIGLKKIDIYNSKSILYTASISHNKNVTVLNSKVLDFAQLEDGSIAILLKNEYLENREIKEITFLVCYDFENKNVKTSAIFPAKMIFTQNCKGNLICTKDGKLAIAGGIILTDNSENTDTEKAYRFLYVCKSNEDFSSGTTYISPDSTDYSEGIETAFTSLWYDENVFYACGYDNCDFNYNKNIHRGIIWKFSADLKESEEIYSEDNTIFYDIDGNSGQWIACGEKYDTGKIVKACFITSALVNQKKESLTYTTYAEEKAYCSFTNVIYAKDKIIFAAETRNTIASTGKTLPLVVAFTSDSNVFLYENSSFTNYTKITGLIPNKIETFVLQLTNDSYSHYVSANLLGNEE